ncbi:MAG: Gfo/Idh/MocA family oxidoreductase [Cyclobacteriaceae bacterium]
MKKSNSNLDRRYFLKASALSGAFLGILPGSLYANDKGYVKEQLERGLEPGPAKGETVQGLTVNPIEQVRVAFIGVGNRGSNHVRRMAALSPKAKVVAICDIREEKARASADFMKKQGQKVDVYSGKEEAWKEMVKRDDIDLVLIATPWEDHAPMAIYSMQQGKHVASEVPLGCTLEECWKLVDTAEQTQRNCMMLENVCYGDEELWILKMVQEGIFGTLTYAEAAYIHHMTAGLFDDKYYEKWRIGHHLTTNGNLYPTHGLGPVAQYMGIGRGDRLDHIVSMSSLQASLTEHAKTVDPGNPYYNRTDFAHGDMNNALIKTHKGRSILMQHDVVTPRPYSRINALAGTKAYHEGYPSRLSLHDGSHDWLPEDDYNEMRAKFKHPIWDELKEEIAKNNGHGGMDFVMTYRMIDAFNKGLPLDMDVYDGADWSVVTPLSATSVELGSIPVKFPDFTRNHWESKRVLEILK